MILFISYIYGGPAATTFLTPDDLDLPEDHQEPRPGRRAVFTDDVSVKLLRSKPSELQISEQSTFTIHS